jgi:hypothetical protein
MLILNSHKPPTISNWRKLYSIWKVKGETQPNFLITMGSLALSLPM